SSRRRHTRLQGDWSSDVCSSDLIFAVMGAHNWHLALFLPQAQQDVWGEDDSIQLSTSLAPAGTVARAEGGFRLSGRWSFSSGCRSEERRVGKECRGRGAAGDEKK